MLSALILCITGNDYHHQEQQLWLYIEWKRAPKVSKYRPNSLFYTVQSSIENQNFVSLIVCQSWSKSLGFKMLSGGSVYGRSQANWLKCYKLRVHYYECIMRYIKSILREINKEICKVEHGSWRWISHGCITISWMHY